MLKNILGEWFKCSVFLDAVMLTTMSCRHNAARASTNYVEIIFVLAYVQCLLNYFAHISSAVYEFLLSFLWWTLDICHDFFKRCIKKLCHLIRLLFHNEIKFQLRFLKKKGNNNTRSFLLLLLLHNKNRFSSWSDRDKNTAPLLLLFIVSYRAWIFTFFFPKEK